MHCHMPSRSAVNVAARNWPRSSGDTSAICALQHSSGGSASGGCAEGSSEWCSAPDNGMTVFIFIASILSQDPCLLYGEKPCLGVCRILALPVGSKPDLFRLAGGRVCVASATRADAGARRACGLRVGRGADREERLVHLLRVNVLKRMESAVCSFALTLKRQREDVE